MEDREKTLQELHDKIDELARQQKVLSTEIQKAQNAIFEFQLTSERKPQLAPEVKLEPKPEPKPILEPPVSKPIIQELLKERQLRTSVSSNKPERKKERTAWEEFIGTNLLNKIGIAILVIGIGFGSKYSIDHNLIDPLTRIIMGYVWGIVLTLIALRLKKSHLNFSAVLLSGSMAIFYVVTFIAYDMYKLMPQEMAFILMVVFTVFTVFASLQYNREVIGIFGLVGAYAVPFLLSDGSGRVIVLFIYMCIINAGILSLAFKRDWKKLYYIAFVLTWLSFGAWLAEAFNVTEHFIISLTFATIFFLVFYTMFLAYKLIKQEALSRLDIVFMLLNSFVYFSFGYVTIDSHELGDGFLGLFTLFTAVIHFIACTIIYKKAQSKETFYFVAGMVLVFLTLAIPVQLDGNWVTLVWAIEAALLFWIGRSKAYPVYEKISYPLIVLAVASLMQDWEKSYPVFYYDYISDGSAYLPFLLNIQYLTTIIVCLSLGFILWLSNRSAFKSPFAENQTAQTLFNYAVPTLLIVTLYFGTFKEVESLWNAKYMSSKLQVGSTFGDYYDQYDPDVLNFKSVWLLYYTAIFALIFTFVQVRIVKNKVAMYVSMGFNALAIFLFITIGLYELSELRTSYLEQLLGEYYYRETGHIIVRYVGLTLISVLLYMNYRYFTSKELPTQLRQTERILSHVVILTLLSSELVHWLEMAHIENSFKLALSILWGLYALSLIIFGLWKDLKYIRVSAFVLFGVTLVKLFAYDMADMSTLAKTIVMISLGVLLLISSFLYNKYKRSPEHETL